MNRITLQAARGFTLIELLVVLVIVSIIGMGSYALLDTFSSTERVLNRRAEEMRRLSMALYRLDDDLRQLTPRPVRNAYTGYEKAFDGKPTEFEFTRLGAANLMGEPRGTLQRLHYGISFWKQSVVSEAKSKLGTESLADEDSGLLLRSRWQVLDRGPDSEPVAEPLLAGVEALNLRYYDRETQVWLAEWPPLSTAQNDSLPDRRLPQAIEVTLVTRSGGEMRRIFSLPNTDLNREAGGNPDG